MTVSPDGQEIWAVSEINHAMRDLVEGSFKPLWISGEIGSLVIHNSGHVYFTLKDQKSQMRGCWFGGAATCRKLGIADGSLVEAFGNLTVYEVRGEYQFSLRTMRLAGTGDWRRQFELVRAKLEAEGLFAPERKKPLPALPRRIGVVSSPSGAAIRDFLQIIRRRNPKVAIRIYPAAVQGDTAAAEVRAGVEFFAHNGDVDVIVVTRGGGSQEDLWPFNDEALARSIAASPIPVISAVGHEIDFTICDFVADLRVPTPSAAAELVSASFEELLSRLEQGEKALRQNLNYRMSEAKLRLQQLLAGSWLRDPLHLVADKRQYLDELTLSMERSAGNAVRFRRERLARLESTLGALNPRKQLERGYAIISDRASNQVVVKKSQVAPGAALTVSFADGEVPVRVEDQNF